MEQLKHEANKRAVSASPNAKYVALKCSCPLSHTASKELSTDRILLLPRRELAVSVRDLCWRGRGQCEE